MLTNLSLKNIKSFKNSSNLKIAPLTLIYGSNSSGISSLWKFLITLKLSLRRGSGNNFINLMISPIAKQSPLIQIDHQNSASNLMI